MGLIKRQQENEQQISFQHYKVRSSFIRIGMEIFTFSFEKRNIFDLLQYYLDNKTYCTAHRFVLIKNFLCAISMMDILQKSLQKYKKRRKNSAYWSKAKNKDWQQKASKAVSKKKKVSSAVNKDITQSTISTFLAPAA